MRHTLQRRALMVALLPALTACMVPPDLVEMPLEDNHPPYIRLDKVTPSQSIVPIGKECQLTRFDLAVVEDQDGDPLTLRWFVDYDTDRDFKAEDVLQVPDYPPGAYLTGEGFTGLTPLLQEWAVGSIHVVEVFVTDAPAFEEGVPGSPLENRTVSRENGHVVMHRWTVHIVEGGEDCGQ